MMSLSYDNLESILAKATTQLSKEFPEVVAVYLFGSQIEGNSHSDSDIDLALLADSKVKLSVIRTVEYQAKVGRWIKTDRLDVVNLEVVPSQIQFAALSRGRLIFCKDSHAVAEFTERLAQSYPDLNRYHETSCNLYRYFLKHRYLMGEKGEKDMIDVNRITEKINYIRQVCLPALKLIATKPQSEFVQDIVAVGGARYYLQTAVEAMLDINNHILSRQGLGIFETHVRTLEILSDSNVLSKSNLSIYIQMIGLRNCLVHMYEQVDNATIHQILTGRLSDFEAYIVDITAFLMTFE